MVCWLISLIIYIYAYEIAVPKPDPKRVLGKDYFPEVGPSVAYVDYLVINGAVVLSAFGDEKADAEAKRIIGEEFPGRVVEQVTIHHLGRRVEVYIVLLSRFWGSCRAFGLKGEAVSMVVTGILGATLGCGYAACICMGLRWRDGGLDQRSLDVCCSKLGLLGDRRR